MINNHFPSSFDVEQTINFRNTSYDGVKRFLQTHGIFISCSSKDQISKFASNILFEHDDYLMLRRLAQGGNPSTNISGFAIQPKLVPITLDELIQDLNDLRNQLLDQEIEQIKRGAPTQRLSPPLAENNSLKIKLEYQRIISGRVELIQRVDSEVEFYLESSSDKQWNVICYPSANQDVKRLERLFRKLGHGSYEPFIINLLLFNQKQRIQFFDDVLDYYSSHKEWQFSQVTELIVRKDSEKESMVDFDDDVFIDEDLQNEEASESDLLGISQAILQGENLRQNSFVKNCERQGYYFPSMTLFLENRDTPELIEIKIRFKLVPQMFEVILATTSERREIGDIPISFSAERQQEILREFWESCHAIWQNIHDDIPQPGKQMTFADFSS